MSATKNFPTQLVGASFASGALAAYVYSRYLQRVHQEANGASRSGWTRTAAGSRTSEIRNPLEALFRQNDIGIHVLNRKLTSIHPAHYEWSANSDEQLQI